MARGKRPAKAGTRRRSAGPASRQRILYSLLALLVAGFFAWALETYGLPGQRESVSAPAASSAVPKEGELQVWFADIGQADCELIRTPKGGSILIDAGEAATGEELVAWLRDRGVEKLDAVLATHPHADHMGGMAQVIDAFPIGEFYMPRVPEDQTPTTRAFESMLEALEQKDLRITAPKAGELLYSEEGLELLCVGPLSSRWDDLNDYSIVCRLTYGSRAFLFTGDAETDAEEEILDSGATLRADVLKCGHHGSRTSTGEAFLRAVSPQWAVISCGTGNDYGHPHPETLQRLEQHGVTLFRTDTQGTILFTSDGETLSVSAGLPSVLPEDA